MWEKTGFTRACYGDTRSGGSLAFKVYKYSFKQTELAASKLKRYFHNLLVPENCLFYPSDLQQIEQSIKTLSQQSLNTFYHKLTEQNAQIQKKEEATLKSIQDEITNSIAS